MGDCDTRANGRDRAESDGSCHGIRVLHVDEPRVAETVAVRLEREDDRLEVLTAADPGRGLECIDGGDVDCVVSDYALPGTDGLAFMADVRERRPDLPFILFTGEGSEAVAGKAVSAGATDYLRKSAHGDPFATLADRIARAVDVPGDGFTRAVDEPADGFERAAEEPGDDFDRAASALGHDIRSPLQVLVGALDLAEETGDAEHFDRARNAVDRMDRLTGDLLALADRERRDGDAAPVELADAAEASWDNVETADAELVVATDRAPRADRGRLEELLENLFGNAVRHGGDDVTVTVGDLDEGDGFYVADDGPGIPEEVREELFDVGVSTHDDGTGLGLAIVDRIAREHGWRVTAPPAEAGARFEVRGVEQA